MNDHTPYPHDIYTTLNLQWMMDTPYTHDVYTTLKIQPIPHPTISTLLWIYNEWWTPHTLTISTLLWIYNEYRHPYPTPRYLHYSESTMNIDTPYPTPRYLQCYESTMNDQPLVPNTPRYLLLWPTSRTHKVQKTTMPTTKTSTKQTDKKDALGKISVPYIQGSFPSIFSVDWGPQNSKEISTCA